MASLRQLCWRALNQFTEQQFLGALSMCRATDDALDDLFLALDPYQAALMTANDRLLRQKGYCSWRQLLVSSGRTVPSKHLLGAAKRGDLAVVKRLVEQGAANLLSAAEIAAALGHYHLLRWLFPKLSEMGYLLSAVCWGAKQPTPLVVALVDVLIAHGSNPTKGLQWVSQPSIAQLLLDRGAYVGCEVVRAALRAGNVPLAEVLIPQMAESPTDEDVELAHSLGCEHLMGLIQVGRNGYPCLHMPINATLSEIFGVENPTALDLVTAKQLLAEGKKISQAPAHYDWELVELCKQHASEQFDLKPVFISGDLDVLAELEHIIDNGDRVSLIRLAVRNGHLAVVRRYWPSRSMIDESIMTLAIANGHLDVVEWLFLVMPDCVRMADRMLPFAIMYRQLPIVKLLLERGSGQVGKEELCLFLPILRLLLPFVPRVDMRSIAEMTINIVYPAEWEAIDLLITHYHPTEKLDQCSLVMAAGQGDERLVADLLTRVKPGMPAVLNAIRSGNDGVLQLLLPHLSIIHPYIAAEQQLAMAWM